MPINLNTGQIILEIPKCGSRSLLAAASKGHGKNALTLYGHHTLATLLRQMPKPLSVVAVVREPRSRFVSQVNFYMRRTKATLADVLQICIEQHDVLFRPQWWFLDWCQRYDTHIFPLERAHDAHCFVAGVKVEPIHYNSGNQLVTCDEIFAHPLAEQAFAPFIPDFPIYERATKWR